MFPRLEKEGGSQGFAVTVFCGQALSVDIFVFYIGRSDFLRPCW